MTFDAVRRALTDALESGKAGTPVALRVSVSLADERVDLAATVESVRRLAAGVFGSEAERLRARRDGSGRQLTVLATHAGGQTSFVSVSRVPGGDALDVVLVGNRGIVRLEGGESLEIVPVHESGYEFRLAVGDRAERAIRGVGVTGVRRPIGQIRDSSWFFDETDAWRMRM